MALIEITLQRGRRESSQGATISWRAHGSGGGACRALVTISASAARQLGWAPGQKVRLLEDDETNELHIVGGEGGIWPLQRNRRSDSVGVNVRLDHRAAAPFPAEPVPTVVDTVEQKVVVTLPAKLRRLRQAPIVSPPPAPPPAPPPPRALGAAVLTDEEEAERMVRSGQGALALAEYFGWELAHAQQVAADVRQRALLEQATGGARA